MEIADVWSTLEHTAGAMERGEGNWENLLRTAQESMRLLYEFPPGEIVRKAEESHYPTKPLIKWLLFEGQRITGISVDRLQGLCDY
jgi:hypothetical protein